MVEPTSFQNLKSCQNRARSFAVSIRMGAPALLLANAARLSLLCSWKRSSSTRVSRRLATVSSGARQVDPPNLEQLCEKARLSLTAQEVADFTPKIASVVDWFAQLQDVDLENVAPAIRVGEVDGASTMRADEPVVFQEREAMLAAMPDVEGPYLKVPKILKENVE